MTKFYETKKKVTKKSGICFTDDKETLKKQFMKLRILITALKVVPSLDKDEMVKKIIWEEVEKVICQVTTISNEEKITETFN